MSDVVVVKADKENLDLDEVMTAAQANGSG